MLRAWIFLPHPYRARGEPHQQEHREHAQNQQGDPARSCQRGVAPPEEKSRSREQREADPERQREVELKGIWHGRKRER